MNIHALNQLNCHHDNWRILGGENVGQCTCLDCGKILRLSAAINHSVKLLDAARERCEKVLQEMKNT